MLFSMSHASTQLGALAQLKEPILLLDTDYTVVDLNHSACTLLQTSKEAFMGETFPFDLQVNEGLEVEFPDDTGQLIPYIVHAQPFVCGQQDCILVRFLQTPPRKSNPKILQEGSKNTLLRLLKQLNRAAIITDDNGNIAHTTNKAKILLSKTGDNLHGRNALQVLEHASSLRLSDERASIHQRLIAAISQENDPPTQLMLELKLEDDRRIDLICIALENRLLPSLASQLIVLEGLDASKPPEQKIALDGKELKLIAAGIAHDFKNILSAIISHLSIARLKIENTEANEKLDAAEEAAWQASTLSQRLMHLADPRKPTGNHHTVYNLAGLLRSCVQMHFKNSIISYELKLENELWDCSVEHTQMTQVINNLLINAQQAMPDGGHIEIKANNSVNHLSQESAIATKQQDFICLRIRDTGPGISPHHQKKIFEPYYTTKAKGHGIGLANCKNIIDAHQGNINVESELGNGSTFIVHIPRSPTTHLKKKVATHISKPLLSSERSHVKKSTEKKGWILVMDDMEAMRDVAGDILNLLGYECAFTEDGQTAINLYKENKQRGQAFDAVLFDLTVPGGMGGEEAANKLKEMDPNLKAIACSGYADSDIMQNFANSPFTTVVPKPYRIQEISDAIKSVLEQS
jgi:signal transduction histidine kinase/CheY-like chemotaxis protein